MKNLYRLFQVLDRWKWHYVFAGLVLLLAATVRMMGPKILQVAIDGVSVQQNQATPNQTPDFISQFFASIINYFSTANIYSVLWGVALLFIAIAGIQAGLRLFASAVAAKSTEKATELLRNRLFEHIQLLPIAQIDKTPTGELIQRCTGDVSTIKNFIGTKITLLVRLFGILAAAIWMMALVHVPYAFIACSMFFPILFTSYFFFKKEKVIWEKHEEEQDKLTAIIQENLSGIRVVKAFAQEKQEIERFERQNQEKLKMGMQHVKLESYFWPFSDFLVALQILISLLAGGYFIIHQQITLGEYASFFTYSMMITWPMRQLGQITSQLGMASVAIDRISQILEMPREDYTGETFEYKNLEGAIEFRNVSFAYPKTEKTKDAPLKWALQNVSFKINAGEKVAIMGGTGAGKSTIIALLLRFYKPSEGAIFLDGKPIESYEKSYLRSRFGVVHQQAFLFSTSLYQNVAYTKVPDMKKWDGKPSDEAVLLAAKDARVFDFLGKLKDGWSTIVGEKGVALSGGQKQRVTLARTLLENPDILVLDDSTSAVDTETEHLIQQALEKRMKGKTALIIAHRLTSVQYADKILVLEAGKLIENGTHQELLRADKFYKQVYDIQISLENSIAEEL